MATEDDGHPSVLVRLPAIEAEELRELIVESCRLKAPKRVLQAYGDHLPGDL
jgi:hypothetical protein